VNLLHPCDLLDRFILPEDLASETGFEIGCVLAGPISIKHGASDHISPPFRFTLPEDRRFHAVSDAARVSFSR
jgi:hypothetical protein